MSSILTEALRCSYKVQREPYNWDVAAFQPGRISFVSEHSHNSQPQQSATIEHVTPQALRVHVTSVLCKGVSVALQATVGTLYGKYRKH